MPSPLKRYALNGVRLVLVVVGLAVAIGTIQALVSMPEPPPDSDGFAHGMAYFFGGLFVVLALGATGLGVALPAILGAEDPLGFANNLLQAPAMLLIWLAVTLQIRRRWPALGRTLLWFLAGVAVLYGTVLRVAR